MGAIPRGTNSQMQILGIRALVRRSLRVRHDISESLRDR